MPEYFVHEKALVESTAIGDGSRIWAFAHVMAGAVIGENCNICGHSFIESSVVIGDRVTIKNGVAVWEGVSIEDDVFVGPFAVFTNDRNPRAFSEKRKEEWLIPTRVGRGSTIGANVTVIAGCDIGRYAFVAAGAVVTRSVPAFGLVMGNPARRSGWVCRCGIGLGPSLICSCGLRYKKREDGHGIEAV